VPEIRYVEFRTMFVLQEISPNYADSINKVKINPYLNLTGKGVLVGIVDTGIDYLNPEFIREDDTSRIIRIWDQSIKENVSGIKYMGEVYTNEKINDAIEAYRNNKDPYSIVPSKDEIGHGTKIAGIIGARGADNELQGIAQDCDYVIVKLSEAANFKKRLEENGIGDIPVYNASEVVAGLEYLKAVARELMRPIVIYLSVGSTEGSHDGEGLIERYVSTVARLKGISLIVGVGNEGASQGHASGNIKNIGDVQRVELNIPREIKNFSFYIWVQKPNRASINVISPTGEETQVIESRTEKEVAFKFVFINTFMNVKYFTPEYFTGHEVIRLTFSDIKPGIWVLKLIGLYITSGRYDIWLPPKDTLPPNTVFLKADSYNTLTIPSNAINIVTVAYQGVDGSLVATSGKGFSLNEGIRPDVITLGDNILSIKPYGGIEAMSGSSAATAIVVGACALFIQWAIVDGNDVAMYAKKLLSYFTYGARRNELYKYPNREMGYGEFDLFETLSVVSDAFRGGSVTGKINPNTYETEVIYGKKNNFTEYYAGKIFIRIPTKQWRNFDGKTKK